MTDQEFLKAVEGAKKESARQTDEDRNADIERLDSEGAAVAIQPSEN